MVCYPRLEDFDSMACLVVDFLSISGLVIAENSFRDKYRTFADRMLGVLPSHKTLRLRMASLS